MLELVLVHVFGMAAACLAGGGASPRSQAPKAGRADVHVLYLEGYPRWQYRYLKNSLKRVKGIQATCLLFDAPNRRAALPSTPEELAKYDVILLGDFFPDCLGAGDSEQRSWLRLLEDFVRHGGGLGTLGGPRAMPYAFQGTLMERLLPVHLEARNTGLLEKGFRPVPARPVHEIVELASGVDAMGLWKEHLAILPSRLPVRAVRGTGRAVLVDHRDSARVVAAVGRYGRDARSSLRRTRRGAGASSTARGTTTSSGET